jgi:hypothetical protein
MKKAALLFLLLAQVAVAAEIPAGDTPTRPEETNSDTNAPAARDPFWPVGYTPPPPTAEQAPVEEEKPPPITVPIEWPALVLKGITKDRAGRYMAVIDGVGLVEAGSLVSMTRNGVNYRWKISDINDKGLRSIRLECVQLEPNPERNKP